MADTPKRRKIVNPKCIARGCLNDKMNHPNISFFRVPENEDKRHKWLLAVGRDDLVNTKGSSYGICEDHFKPQMINTVRMLNSTAEPSTSTSIFHDVELEPSDIGQDEKSSSVPTVDRTTQTEDNPSNCLRSQHSPRPNIEIKFEPSSDIQIDEQDIGSYTTLVHRIQNCKTSSSSQEDVTMISENKSEAERIDEKVDIHSRCFAHKPILINKSITTNLIMSLTFDKDREIKLEPVLEIDADLRGKEAKYIDKGTQSFVSVCTEDDLKKNEGNIQKIQNYELLIHSLKKKLKTLRRKVIPPVWSDDEFGKKISEFQKWVNQIAVNHENGLYKDRDFDVFALNLYVKSRYAYKYLSDTLNLPNVNSLKKLKIPQPSQLNQQTLDCLTNKLKSLPDKAKYCCLVIDSVDLKRHLYYNITADEIIGLHYMNGQISNIKASAAYFIILRGIAVDWKQLVGYTFLAHDLCYLELNYWLNAVIETLSNLGIKIMALTTSQEQRFNLYACSKSVSVDRPFFMANEQKIYYIFDAPHLLTCLRNDLIYHDFYYNKNHKISWYYIKALYAFKHLKLNNALPKITDAHITPNPTERKEVKYAAQIFSKSVFSTFDILMSVNFIPKEANPTAQFVKTINDLFDVLNSNKLKCDNEYQAGFTASKNQMEAITNALALFKCLNAVHKARKVDVTADIDTFKNIQITAHAAVLLSGDLKKLGIKQVLTRRLNKEPADSFKMKLNPNDNNSSKVAPVKFTREFTKQFLLQMLPNSRTEKLQNDFCEMLMKGNLVCDSARITNSEDNKTTNTASKRGVTINNKNKETTGQKEDVDSSSIADPMLMKDNMVSSLEMFDKIGKRKMRKTPLSLNGNYDYRFQLPKKDALTYVASYLLYKCSKKHKCPDFDAVLSNKSLIELDENINEAFPFSGRLKLPDPIFKDYVTRLEYVFVNRFSEAVISKPATEMLRFLQQVRFHEPCQPCNNFPTDYLLTLFIRLRIYLTLVYNRYDYSSVNVIVKPIVD